jgi:hypothetical protein
VPVAEAQPCAAACGWCPCGAHAFDVSARGLRVNGGGSGAMLLHFATGKAVWEGVRVPPYDEAATCVRASIGAVGSLEGGRQPDTTLRADLREGGARNRPSKQVANLIKFPKRSARIESCTAATVRLDLYSRR